MRTTIASNNPELILRSAQARLAGEPVACARARDSRAAAFLDRAWDETQGHFPLFTGCRRDLAESTASPPESFTAVIIADLLAGRAGSAVVRRVVAMLERELDGRPELHFFKDHALLPPDADCTALALSLLLRVGQPVAALAHRALDRILAHTDGDGVITTYFQRRGDRAEIVDPVVCINALYLAHQLGRAGEMARTQAFVAGVLSERRYLDGTRYYPSAETFLYFLGRLVCAFPRAHIGLRTELREAVAGRLDRGRWPLDLAQLVWLARQLDLGCAAAEAGLVAMQRADGSWPADCLFRYGRSGVLFGSSALTTAFGAAALAVEPTDPASIQHRGGPRAS